MKDVKILQFQILSCYNLKISFYKLVKVLALEFFYGTRTQVHFSISVLVLVLEEKKRRKELYFVANNKLQPPRQ